MIYSSQIESFIGLYIWDSIQYQRVPLQSIIKIFILLHIITIDFYVPTDLGITKLSNSKYIQW